MNNAAFLECYTDCEEYSKTGKLRLPLESFVTFCVYKTCRPNDVALYFLPVTRQNKNEICVHSYEDINFISPEEIPWSVAMCLHPNIFYENTVITGLCAVARHICKYRSSPSYPEEHEEGLLGFRKSCLQAPNEVSIWTKFCEVDLLRTVLEILNDTDLKEIPTNLVRFENHLSKPVRVHNVYKIARNIKKENILEENIKISNKANEEINNERSTTKIRDDRVPKTRKWKSNIKKELEVDCSTKIEDLDVTHKFAEGPFLTLADFILLPLYHILRKRIGSQIFESVLPLTNKWFANITSIPELDSIKNLLRTVEFTPLSIENVIVPNTDDISLYKCDPKRHNPKKRLFTKEVDVENALSMLLQGMELTLTKNELEFGSIKWDQVPDGANPAAGHLPDERTVRKTQQLENLTLAVMSIAKDGDLIVDFCCGSGHLGILLAYLLPKCKIILLENKEQSLLRAKSRVTDVGLKNVYFYQCNLDFFIGKFDLGIGLHACGIASDLVLDKCLKANAKFVLCPCCYGSLHATDRLVYPRSGMFDKVSLDQYMCIGHAADQTHKDHPLTVRGARCMGIIDSDRGRLAQEFGYTVTLTRLTPLSCTPKNNLLIGIPS